MAKSRVYGFDEAGYRDVRDATRQTLGSARTGAQRTRRQPVLSGSGLGIIRFTITSVDGDEAEVTIDNVGCGQSIPDPATATVHDAIGCLLDEDEADLIDRKGYAVKMLNPDHEADPDNEPTCRWEMIALCCPDEGGS